LAIPWVRLAQIYLDAVICLSGDRLHKHEFELPDYRIVPDTAE